MKHLIFILILIFSTSALAKEITNVEVRDFLNGVSVSKQTQADASFFLKRFFWFNIHYERNSIAKKTFLKWSHISEKKIDKGLLKNIFEGVNLKAPIKRLKSLPTVNAVNKDTCEIEKKWRNIWWVYKGNYQLDELKKLGLPLTFLSKPKAALEKQIKRCRSTLVYFNDKGQDVFICLVEEKGKLHINFAGFRQECDT